MALQGMVFGLHHFNSRDLSLRQLKLLIATELSCRAYKVSPSKEQIGNLARIELDEMDPEFAELVERRYLHEVVPTFGDNYTYKLGSIGGTVIRHMLKEGNYDTKPQPTKTPTGVRARRGPRT